MGSARPRMLACALIALASLTAAAPAAPAAAKKHQRHVYPFGSRQLGPGAKGKDVRFLQRALGRLGIATGVDGVYGKSTFKSVEALESQRGWPVDGIVSKKDAGRIMKLLSTAQASGSYFVEGSTAPTLTVTARHAGNTKVKVLNAAGSVVQSFGLVFAGPESRQVGWNGTAAAGVAPDGTYRMQLAKTNTAGATATGQTEPFGMHLHAFPLPGTHDFGGPDSRFGAPRAGHTHQGQDVAAACGQTLVVDEAGVVKVNAYQASGAGYYVVLHGGLTGTDSVYMHLQAPSPYPVGTTIYAGAAIGKVGDTGDAEGCHLHFERWSAPGWYSGGAPYDPLPELLYWDTYS
jgi:peptidoglycan hydrolase-like protein with peptidoglycan-binding domain